MHQRHRSPRPATGLAIAAAVLGSWAMAASAFALSEPTEGYLYQDVYGGLAVEAMRLGDGEFSVNILIDGAKRATYELSASALEGHWSIFEEDDGATSVEPKVTMDFDYSQADTGGGEDAIEDLLARHSLRSVALSAILLWEDHEAGYAPLTLSPDPEVSLGPQSSLEQGGLPAEDDYTDCIGNGVCRPVENGCSFVPDNCPPFSTQTIRESCQEHDRCYQCGEACFGRTRFECDRNLRINVTHQANALCGWLYFLGVRALGWAFYQTAAGGIGLMNDVYSIGVNISACEGQYAHMCTIYVF